MDNYRPIQGQDYGILRKKEGKEEELFVFGYSCKVYEDYDKSLYVDQGKHLIPWLGDETLKIDRYDCRGALNDLTKYLPKSESFDLRANLSNEEKRIEQLCDQERYRALTTNEEEEILLQEEELKRLQQALNNEKSYGEVGFTYDNDSKPSSDATQKEINTEEDDEAFIPPYQLDVPLGMKIPKSKKHHEIIERTAFFIHDQGSQMEILLKIKQAENPQFNFLSFDNELHPYYRHLLMAVKNQRYKPTQAASPEKEKSLDTSNDDTYLHPSLIQNSQPVVIPESASKIPNITYKPSTDCTYSALVNRIKETQTSSLLEAFKKKFSNDPSSTANNNSSNFKNDNGTESTSSLPLSALTKSARRRRIRKEKHKAAAASFKIYYAEEEVKNVDEDEDEAEELENKTNQVEISEATKNADTFNTCVLKPVPAPAPIVELPPSDIQLIIDKMASYVAKNGRDFEDVVRNKGDPRFLFLNKTHVYNAYYHQKVELYLQLENPQIVPVPAQKPVTEKPPIPAAPKVTDHRSTKKSISKSSKSSKSKQPIPICFSIKKPKDQEALEIKSALPYEESEGEDDEENEDSIREKPDESVDEKVEKLSQPEFPESPVAEQPKQENTKKASDMTLEKWAQERLRAKLVTAAKEKLAAKAAREKDKQLQAERRKKAAEFINLLQKDNLVNRIQASEGNFSTSNGKKDISDVITIPSDSSASDSDSIISVPLSEEEEKHQQIKRKIEESNREIYEKTKRKFTSYAEEKSKYMRTKHRDHADDHNNSPPYSKHSHSKYKKYDKEKKTHSKKKKHRHSRNDVSSSSSNKKSHKDHHKSKRSRYASDDTDGSDSSASYSSVDGKK